MSLKTYLTHAQVSIDTNHLERALRVIPMGRKNHLFCWSELGAQQLGVLHSLTVTCKLHNINPYHYLVDVLQRVFATSSKRRYRFNPSALESIIRRQAPALRCRKSEGAMTHNETKTTIDISHLSIDQLYILNQYVVERIDELQAKQDKEALAALRPGMTVQFTHDGSTVTGTLLKKNRKTVLIGNNNGKTRHKVPAGIVRQVCVAKTRS